MLVVCVMLLFLFICVYVDVLWFVVCGILLLRFCVVFMCECVCAVAVYLLRFCVCFFLYVRFAAFCLRVCSHVGIFMYVSTSA